MAVSPSGASGTLSHCRDALGLLVAVVWMGFCTVPISRAGELKIAPDLRRSMQAGPKALTKIDSHTPSTAAMADLVDQFATATPKRIGPAGKVSVHLQDFIEGHKGLADAGAVAKSAGIQLVNGRVSVIISLQEPQKGGALSVSLQRLGSTVRLAGDTFVAAEVPVDKIEEVASLSGVRFISPDWKYQPLDTNSALGPTDGVTESRVAALHAQGITGRNIKIGVLDLGFQRYSELTTRNVVPKPAAARAFGEMTGVESETEHGTACTEIVHAMAPDATIYTAAFDGTTSAAMEGANWLAQQGVDVISASWGGHFAPLNGKGPLDLFIDELVTQRHILWVNAAGNEAQRHWRGQSVDANGNHLIDVDNGTGPPDAFIVHFGGGGFRLSVTWDDWGSTPLNPGSTVDIDEFLVYPDPQTQKLRVIASSQEEQSGHQAPIEQIVGKSGEIPQGIDMFLLLRATHVTRAVPVHVLAEGSVQLRPINAEGSVGSPAEASNALAVGAVDVTTHQFAPYSSQGPTDDGRTEPRVSAPTNTLSVAYSVDRQGRFPGTSSATPHVTGFAALVKQIHPTLSGAALRDAVIALVRPMGTPVPNNQYGYGHIDGERLLAGNSPGPGVPPGSDTPAPTPAPSAGGLTDALDELIRQQKNSPK